MVANEVGEHVVERNHGHGEDEHDPEQASELPDMVSVTGVPAMSVIAVSIVVLLDVVIAMIRGLVMPLGVGAMASVRVGLAVT